MTKCCEKCLSSKYALKGKMKEKFGGICGLVCECHNPPHLTFPDNYTPTEGVEELQNEVVDCIFNREAGWSKKLENILTKYISEAEKRGARKMAQAYDDVFYTEGTKISLSEAKAIDEIKEKFL